MLRRAREQVQKRLLQMTRQCYEWRILPLVRWQGEREESSRVQ